MNKTDQKMSVAEEAEKAVHTLRSSLLEDNPHLLDEFDVRTIDDAVRKTLVHDLKRENAISEKYIRYLSKKHESKDETGALMQILTVHWLMFQFYYAVFKRDLETLFIFLKSKISAVFRGRFFS